MSQRYIGSSISPTAAPTTSTSTTGVWSINDQYQAKNVGNWPMYVPPATTDPYFPYVSMLLPGNGTNGAQNNTFLDSSTNNFTITRNGNTTQGTASPYYSCWSNYFDGSGDYLSTPDNAAFTLASNDFTFECWIYPTTITSGNNNILAQWGSGNAFIFRYIAAGRPQFSGAGTNVTGTTTAVVANQWNHLAITRSGTTVRLFVNGVMDATTGTIGALTDGASQVTIGAYSDGTSEYVTGYISNLRLVNGTAVYTSTFTPQTTPLTAITNTVLLTCQSNRFIDNSAKNLTITKNGDTSVQKFSPFEPVTVTPASYSGYFDGTGDYLTVPYNTAFSFPGDFTMEAWVYPLAYSGNNCVAGQWVSGLNFIFKVVSGNRVNFVAWVGGTSYQVIGTTTTVDLNKWSHVAVTRSSNVIRIFVNGVLDSSTVTVSGTLGGTDPLTIGSIGTIELWNGDISNFRIVKGTALYTTTFTPPTSPLTAVSGTSILTCQSSTFIDNSSNAFAITVNGDTKPLATSPFTPTTSAITPYAAATNGGSAYFDGAGDRLTISANAALGMGSGNFTIEFWLYQTVLADYKQILDIEDGNSTGRLILWVDGGGTLYNLGQNGGARNSTAAGAIKINTWTHVVLTRASGTTRFYINGVQSGSNYTDSTNYTCTTGSVFIGTNSDGATYPYSGYISNIRFVKGTAVYTSAFVPPAAPVTAITNTSLLVNATNGGIIDNASISDFETVGTSQIGTGQSKFGGSSAYFPAKTDVLSTLSNKSFATLGGDFTIECWVYPTDTSLSTMWGIIDARAAGASASAWFLGLSNYSSGWLMSFYNSGFNYGTTRIQANTWTHCAWVRVGSTLTFYVNGTAGGTATISGAITGGTTTVVVGGKDNNLAGYGTIGYIDDLRITNGYARYTTNFTPPTTAFPTA